MKKIKFALTAIMLDIILGSYTLSAQGSDNASNSSSSSVTTTTTTTPDQGWMNNPTALAIGAAGIVILAIVIVMIYRNRRNTIGGIQSQDRRSPEPATTQSINNPGAGV